MYKQAWQALIKPDRAVYPLAALAPHHISSKTHIEHFQFANPDGFLLQGTFYRPGGVDRGDRGRLDVVVYLHTRGGSRLEGLFLVPLLASKLGVVLFDFAGSGESEGEYITLGPKEARDTGVLIEFIRKNFGVGQVILWGRSMGAVAAILFASEHRQAVSGLILDSPFSCFRRMIYDIVYSRRKVPLCLIDIVLLFLIRTVRAKTGVSMDSIKPIKCVSQIEVPCFYMVSHEDLISRPDKVKDLYLKTGAATKEFYLTQGEHNSIRNKEAIFKAMGFCLGCLGNRIQRSLSVQPEVAAPSDDPLAEFRTGRTDTEPLLRRTHSLEEAKGPADGGLNETNKLD